MKALLQESLLFLARVADILLAGVRIPLWKPVGVAETESAAILGALPRGQTSSVEEDHVSLCGNCVLVCLFVLSSWRKRLSSL